MNVKKSLFQNLSDAKHTHETLMLLIENRDFQSASLVCHFLLKQLTHIVDRLNDTNEYARAYVGVLLKTRMTNFHSDCEFLEHISTSVLELKSNVDSDRLLSVCNRMPTYVGTIETAIKTVFPSSSLKISDIEMFLKKHRWKMAGILTILIVVAAGILIGNRWKLRHHSLVGEYFYNQDFTNRYKKVNDPKIDFNWGYGSPFLGFKQDHFSVRWTGYLRIPVDGTYEFSTSSDDGIRLWIEDKLIIENWTFHSATTDKATMSLKAGFVPIHIEYFEENSNAQLKLFWKYGANSDPHIIESEFFSPTGKS